VSEPDYDAQSTAITEAIHTALRPDMVTGYVLIASVIQEDGQQGLQIFVDDDARSWDTLGRLEYARAIEHAAINAGYAEDDDD
jgi:hypothetical protein